MRDIRDQLAAYAEILDQRAPQLEELVDVPRQGRRRAPRLRPVWVVGAAAVGVLILVGGMAALGRRTTTSLPPSDTSSTSTVATLPPVTVDLLNPSAVTPTTFSGPDHAFAGPGAVVVVEEAFHMLSAAYGDGAAAVGYAVSSDGIIWTQGAAEPVLDLAAAPWAPLEFDHALPRTAIVGDDGRWQLFFEISWLDKNRDKFRSNIGRATADDPRGPWTFDDEPVLRPNESLPWASQQVGSPSVIPTEDGLVMLFVGYGEGSEGVVGLAQSTDGASWDVRPGPVFSVAAEWARGSIVRVDAVAAPGGFALFYAGDTPSRRGLAVSTDALEWVAHPGNPLLTTLDVPRASMFDSEFVVDGKSVLAYIENGGVRSEREVVVLRMALDLGDVLGKLAADR